MVRARRADATLAEVSDGVAQIKEGGNPMAEPLKFEQIAVAVGLHPGVGGSREAIHIFGLAGGAVYEYLTEQESSAPFPRLEAAVSPEPARAGLGRGPERGHRRPM